MKIQNEAGVGRFGDRFLILPPPLLPSSTTSKKRTTTQPAAAAAEADGEGECPATEQSQDTQRDMAGG